ncbi:hypothetical protein ATCC90586_010945 [Pythium insidiosum]|nr:hypothetical protein ATCC90586_010945 [Pythium insidiosum]
MASHRESYGSGQLAVDLDADGCGFCYYESGRVAACVNRVNDYQRSFQFYQDNAKRTLLATFDEHAVGSAGHPKGKKLLLTKDGGMILQADDVLVKVQ